MVLPVAVAETVAFFEAPFFGAGSGSATATATSLRVASHLVVRTPPWVWRIFEPALSAFSFYDVGVSTTTSISSPASALGVIFMPSIHASSTLAWNERRFCVSSANAMRVSTRPT